MKYLKIIGLLIVLGIYSACNSDDNDTNTKTLSGIYTESEPVNGRTKLNFVNGNTVIKSGANNPFQDEFTYEITKNVIKLTPKRDSKFSQEFKIEIINNSKFKIENLYGRLEFMPITYMTFEK